MSEASVEARRRSVGFLLRFLVLLVVFYFIVASRPVNDAVIVPFTARIASVSGWLLNALPARWSRRLLGLAVGFLAIQLLNLVRVITLFWIGLHRPALFSSSHTVIWQSVVVLFGVLLFLLWASRERRLSTAPSPTVPDRSRKG